MEVFQEGNKVWRRAAAETVSDIYMQCSWCSGNYNVFLSISSETDIADSGEKNESIFICSTVFEFYINNISSMNQ